MKTQETNCLESILGVFFNDGKKQKLFLSKVKKDSDGYVTDCFTKKGGEVYGKFVDFCYGIGNVGINTIGDLKNFVKSLENIGLDDNSTWMDVVETTDIISNGH